jgi:hypothetical protein
MYQHIIDRMRASLIEAKWRRNDFCSVTALTLFNPWRHGAHPVNDAISTPTFAASV